MKSKHTPGPWECSETDQFCHSVDIWESKTARTLARTVLNLPIEEQRHNARLIAAAPDLLEALQNALVCLAPTGQDTRSDRAIKEAEAAIAKATGVA